MWGDSLLWELFALGAYVLYIYFSYCDGFGLHPLRKILWALLFLLISYYSFKTTGRFVLSIILSVSALGAFVLTWSQNRENKKSQRKYYPSEVTRR